MRRARGESAARLSIAALVSAAAIATILIAGCGRRGAEQGGDVQDAGERVGPFLLTIRNRPASPSVGDNRLEIGVRDTTGAPVRGARVEVLISMDAMGAMPRMESRGEVHEAKNGIYEAGYGLAMAGE